MPKQKRPFVVEIEAKLIVHAFDEESARKKVEKAFADDSNRPYLGKIAMPKQKRPFVVEIEAKLTVHAFVEESARKKVSRRSQAVGHSASMSTLAPEGGPAWSCQQNA